MRHVLVVLAAALSASAARAEQFEILAPIPPFSPFVEATSINQRAGVIVDISEPLQIESVGAFFRVAPPFPDGLAYARVFLDSGELISTGPPTLVPPVTGWHDLPLSVVLHPGRYELDWAIIPQRPGENWFGAEQWNTVSLVSPFQVGPFIVVDSHRRNFAQPSLHLLEHLRIDATRAIPEPSAWLIAVTALALCALRRLARSRWRARSAA